MAEERAQHRLGAILASASTSSSSTPRMGSHVWADRFDRELADIFMLQDEVVGRIVSALSGVLPSARPVARHRAANLEAYDPFVLGRLLVNQSAESNKAARPLLERSIELDPAFADAHAWLAMSHLGGWLYRAEPAEQHRSISIAAASAPCRSSRKTPTLARFSAMC